MVNAPKSVLRGQRITEKGALVEANRQYLFKVQTDANKSQIKNAVESEFKVKVSAVNTVNMEGKVRRFGRTTGRRKDYKKAYVTLKEGFVINPVEAETPKE